MQSYSQVDLLTNRLHFNICPASWAVSRKLALHAEHLLRAPSPHPDQPPDHSKDDTGGGENGETITRHSPAPSTGVQKAVGVESLSAVRQIREREVEGEYHHQTGEM